MKKVNWKKQVSIKTGGASLLINKDTKSILCWGQPLNFTTATPPPISSQSYSSSQQLSTRGLFQWTPIEFKTPEGAEAFASEGTVGEMEEILQAVVEWRANFISDAPAPREFKQNKFSVVKVHSAPQPPENASAPADASQSASDPAEVGAGQ
jgi:hypothetical protein